MDILLSTIERNAFTCKEIPLEDVVLSDQVRKLCEQNRCGSFGKNWTCPPAVRPLDLFRQELAKYSRFILLYKVFPLTSSYDWNGMVAAAKTFQLSLVELKHELTEKLGGKLLFLGAGACQLCKTCGYPEGESCRNPEDALVSVEACGIDVMALMQQHDMKYYIGPDTVTYIGAALV